VALAAGLALGVPEARRLAAERLRATPDDALVVTQLLEPYLEPLALRGR
jgi:hypothetical protein